MDVGAIIALVIVAIAIVALVLFFTGRAKERKVEQRRAEAHEHREEGKVRDARASRAEAEAEERAARAKREQALAEEHAATAKRERRFAREKLGTADELDPDVDGDGRRDDREQHTERVEQTRR